MGGCLFAASAAWANDVGYVDCSTHSDDTQVFEKARKSQDAMASLPCGERFNILIYGFVFSKIQTRDGKIGYVFSNLISIDRSGVSTFQPASERTPVYKPQDSDAAAVKKSNPPPAPAQNQAPPAQSNAAHAVNAQMAAPPSNPPATPAAAPQPNPPAPVQNQPAPVPSNPAQPASPQGSLLPPSNVPVTPELAGPATPPAPPAPPQPTKANSAPPKPDPAEAPAPDIRATESQNHWEKPRFGVRKTPLPLMEVYGGYAFGPVLHAGTTTNFNGALGSFGYNFKPWLQFAGDTSYSYYNVTGTKYVLYGNHYGPRFFYRTQNRWNLIPFGEVLVGGSRLDATVSGVGGYKTSQNTFSIKAGGGLDVHPSRRVDIRLFDVDYYRTSFGTNVNQGNYWVSAGIVLHLLIGRSQY